MDYKNNTALPSRNRSKWIKVTVFVVLLVGAILLSYLTTSGRLGSFNFNEQELVRDDQVTERFYREIQERTYDEILEELGEDQTVITSPNLSNQESRERLDSITGRSDPDNVSVIFADGSLSSEYVLIQQGDLVTWRNESQGTGMSIEGNGWGTFESRDPGTAFSQRFDFLGVFEYTVNLEDEASITGIIEVVSSIE